MKFYPITLLIFLFGNLTAQSQRATELYNKAVAKYKEQQYEEAERLFTKSLDASDDGDTYFSRGLCRGKLADRNGYCSDMAQACAIGNDKALKLFTKTCGKIDTLIDKRPGNGPHNILSKILVFQMGDSSMRFIQKYYSQELTKGYEELMRSNNADTTGPEVAAEYPGGVMELMKFVQTNIRFPSNVHHENGKVFLKFAVYEDGTIHDITVLKNQTCDREYAEEATRIVALMPPWKPARIGKKLVKTYINLPISFKIQ